MVNNQFIQDSRLENFVNQALEVHSVISIEVSRQLLFALNNLNNANTRVTKLKQALDLIDQLDLFLESPADIEQFYLSVQSKLLQILKELKIQNPLFPSTRDLRDRCN